MVLTRGSERRRRKEVFTVAEVALPPVSRKLAQGPEREERASIVFRARPAPFTVGCWVELGEVSLGTEGEDWRKGVWCNVPSVPIFPSPFSLEGCSLIQI